MMTTRFIGSAFIFAAITCIFAVPIQQLHDETMGLNEGVYTQPELAEALARSYAALEWAQRNDELSDEDIQVRNLDHIGGGNLLRQLQERHNGPRLRNLDSIGGGNLLRSLERSEYQRQNQMQSRPNNYKCAGRIQNSRDETRAHLRQPSHLNPGLTFENRDSDLRRKSGWPITVNGMEIYEGSLKRNIDEIDRTGFDNFVKRNFDEIDRSGWDSFVKRRIANAYLAARQH
ncbi:uncharacterized protein LOC130667372 [Microplitis mediator]|uniref:uncharacterized protein LOC130667372 n=1 Tax=Microplitis mediator TaxID=375433 RepID=UPI002557A976|nr:uncharacterized protein LOC130667372 [Microplitis mediator]